MCKGEIRNRKRTGCVTGKKEGFNSIRPEMERASHVTGNMTYQDVG